MENKNENTSDTILDATISEIPPIEPNNDVPNNAAPISSEANQSNDQTVNQTAIPVTAEQIIEKRGRGRPKGSANKKGKEGLPPAQDITQIINENSDQFTASEISFPEGASEPQATPATPEVKATDYAELAKITVVMGTSTMAMIFGPEWQPEDENEATQLSLAVAKYMESKQVQDIPPGALLALVLITYSAKRLRADNTRTKIKMGWLWVKSKFSRKKITQPQANIFKGTA